MRETATLDSIRFVEALIRILREHVRPSEPDRLTVRASQLRLTLLTSITGARISAVLALVEHNRTASEMQCHSQTTRTIGLRDAEPILMEFLARFNAESNFTSTEELENLLDDTKAERLSGES